MPGNPESNAVGTVEIDLLLTVIGDVGPDPPVRGKLPSGPCRNRPLDEEPPCSARTLVVPTLRSDVSETAAWTAVLVTTPDAAGAVTAETPMIPDMSDRAPKNEPSRQSDAFRMFPPPPTKPSLATKLIVALLRHTRDDHADRAQAAICGDLPRVRAVVQSESVSPALSSVNTPHVCVL